MPTIHKSEHLVIRHYRASAYVRVVRSEAPFSVVSEVISVFTACRDALNGISPAKCGILFDWRSAPISTDANLHKALVEHMDAMAEPFARRAILVETPVGTMQVNRVARTLTDDALVIFRDEAAAIEFVSGH